MRFGMCVRAGHGLLIHCYCLGVLNVFLCWVSDLLCCSTLVMLFHCVPRSFALHSEDIHLHHTEARTPQIEVATKSTQNPAHIHPQLYCNSPRSGRQCLRRAMRAALGGRLQSGAFGALRHGPVLEFAGQAAYTYTCIHEYTYNGSFERACRCEYAHGHDNTSTMHATLNIQMPSKTQVCQP